MRATSFQVRKRMCVLEVHRGAHTYTQAWELDPLRHAWVEVYINATSVKLVCMYTSINIVSLCITFWGSPEGRGLHWVALCCNRKKPSQAEGFETYITALPWFCVDEMHVLTFLFDFFRRDQTYTHCYWGCVPVCSCMFEANFHHRQMVFKHTYML